MLAQYESRQRHGSSNLEPKSVGALKRDPINLNAELDTVSERSEIDEDPTIAESIKRGKTYFKYEFLQSQFHEIIFDFNTEFKH